MASQSGQVDNRRRAHSNLEFSGTVAGLVSLLIVVLSAVAQERTSPSIKIVTQPLSVAVFTSFEPGEHQGELRLRVALGSTSPASSPGQTKLSGVAMRDSSRGIGREIRMSFDAASGDFVGTIDRFETSLAGFLQIKVVDNAGEPEYHFTSFAVFAPTRNPITPVHTTDGQMTLFLTPSSLPESARIIASTQERLRIPLPPEAELVNGPYNVLALSQPDSSVKTMVNIRVPAGKTLASRKKATYVVRRLDPVTRTWKRLPTLSDSGGFVQAASDHLGTFVLTAE